MTTADKASLSLRCELEDLIARDLMTANPVFLRGDASDDQAIRVLADKGITAVVVIDHAGRPQGVLTATDVLIHQRAKLSAANPNAVHGHTPVLVRDMMTPAVFSVRTDTPARQVIEQMVALNVHRLFVVDESDVVLGVISALGVLRAMV